jgi:hypothetical protein
MKKTIKGYVEILKGHCIDVYYGKPLPWDKRYSKEVGSKLYPCTITYDDKKPL